MIAIYKHVDPFHVQRHF